MREQFIDRNFNNSSQVVIDAAVGICEEYAAQGYDLTLRQLYYQFVSRGLIPNKDTEYKRLGSIINDARLAGLLDWDYIVDRTRFLRDYDTKDSPSSAIMEAARSYIIDLWEDQPYRPEVWIEKDALVGVIETICHRLRIPFFSCRGYVSQSEMYEAAQRMQKWSEWRGDDVSTQTPIIFHLGDHDPSGIDMTRDIQERLDLFGANCEVNRIALTMDQIRAINPPPNPTKLTDARSQDYVRKYGMESWELDALDPAMMSNLIEDAIYGIRDDEKWTTSVAKEVAQRGRMMEMAVQIRDENI